MSGFTVEEERGDGEKVISESFGLGLAISRALARLMGGELDYRRTELTEFVLSLPIDRERYGLTVSGGRRRPFWVTMLI